jgi:hypothetical protein
MAMDTVDIDESPDYDGDSEVASVITHDLILWKMIENAKKRLGGGESNNGIIRP